MKNLIPYYSYLKLCPWKYFFGIIAGIVNGAASGFGMAFIAAKILPFIFSDTPRNEWALVGVVLLVPAVAIIRGVSAFLSSYWMGYCNNQICLALRKDMMQFMQRLSLSFFHKTRTGLVMARVLNDTSRISSVVTRSTSDLVRQPVTILGAFAVIIYLSYKNDELYFLLFVFALLPFCIYTIKLIGARMTNREKQMGASEGSLNSIVHETIEGAREARAFNLHEKEQDKFNFRAEEQVKISLRLLAYKNIISPVIEILTAFGVGGAILYAALANLDLETILPLLMALYVCYQPFKKLGSVYADIQRASLAAGRIEKVYHSKERLELKDEVKPCSRFSSEIEFKDVTFAYSKKAFVMKRMSLTLKKGETVAIIGPSGSGKTTFCNLLCRFYDPKQGSIYYDGVDLREFDENEYRQHISIVSQDSFLFADTLMNNIRVGRLNATDKEVMDAASKANAHEFIEELPDGYSTVVAERGASLSGGQRQRIAIARAFLKDSEILILDEATSAVDMNNERKIHDALSRLLKDKTVLIIAHQYSTVRLAQRMLIFGDGGSVLQGTEVELEKQSDFLRKMQIDGKTW